MDAAKAAGVQHFVYSGLENVKEAIGKSCHHFDGKAQVESYLKEQGTYSELIEHDKTLIRNNYENNCDTLVLT